MRDTTKALAAANKFFSEEPWWLENMVRRILQAGYDDAPPLDPKPMVWESSHWNLNGVRLGYRQLLKGTGHPVFAPRDEYSQDEKDYK